MGKKQDKAKKADQRLKNNMLLYQPDDLTEAQAAKYASMWGNKNKKAGLNYLRSQGYKPKQIAGARLGSEEPLPVKSTPSQQRYFDDAMTATQTSMDVAATMADRNAQLNRPNQTGAFGGSQGWTQDENGNWTKTTSLSDSQQGMMSAEDQYSLNARNAALGMSGQAFQAYQQPYNYDQISQVMGGQQLGDARNKAASSAYESQMALMRPEFDQQKADFEQMAAERGWVPGSKVYELEKNRLANNQTTQARSIADNAYNQGLNEYNTMFNTSTSDRARQIQEMNSMRDRPLQEVSTLMGQGPGIRGDQFVDYGAIQQQTVDPMQAYGIQNQNTLQNDQQKWQQRQNQLDRNLQMQIAQMGMAGGPAGPEGPGLDEQMQAARDQMMWEQQNGFRPNYQNSGGGGGNVGGQIAGGIASGIGTGIGAGIANGIMR